ncbi:hypothetical protein [Nitratireductor aquibiodomus]|nr:hypothetical protein [Nitratireductor aquibiodomus]
MRTVCASLSFAHAAMDFKGVSKRRTPGRAGEEAGAALPHAT